MAAEKKPRAVVLGRGKLWFYFGDLVTVDISNGVPKEFSAKVRKLSGQRGALLWLPDPPKPTKRGKR